MDSRGEATTGGRTPGTSALHEAVRASGAFRRPAALPPGHAAGPAMSSGAPRGRLEALRGPRIGEPAFEAEGLRATSHTGATMVLGLLQPPLSGPLSLSNACQRDG